ncbi:MAG: prepilin-type N-terminal cleavage/methylation domain-containing protein [Lachnospiraceae bacterium]|nr:prepilin-type N-terminal cleavage/methylation domain-containing protein [Lachnospiraceae bacterium]
MSKSNLKHEPYEAQLNKNAGFSLIELLIAVIVLAIIIVPFSRSFISSSRMNGNSRRLQRATTVAQDIVEGLKAYNIDELKEQFNNPLDGFYIVDSKLIHGTIEEDTMREQNDLHYSGEPDAPGVYYFVMEDFKIQNVEYDALIKVDASVYDKDNTDPTDPYKHDNAFNASDMAKPGSVMKNRDGSYKQPVDLTKAVLDAILDDSDFGLGVPGALVIPDGEEFSFKMFKNMGGKIERTITIDISKDPVGGMDENGNPIVYCNANITFDYECTYNGGAPKHFYGKMGSHAGVINNVPCASKITSGNFYLFYYPCYEAQTDNIIINNTSGEPFQIFIVKQVEIKNDLDSEGNQQQLLSDAQLNNAETLYKATVNVKDTSSDGINNTVIRTNLGMNLVNSTFTGGGFVRPTDGHLPTYKVEKEDIPAQVTYKFNNAVSNDVNVFGLAGTRLHGTGGNSIVNDKITEVIFDIEVSIYRQGAYDEGFPDTMRMVVIEGSKNN